jgi:hypothetical protein
MSNALTWVPPSNFSPSNTDPSWIRSIDLKKYPLLYTKKNEPTTYDLAQIEFKALGEFWINRSSITQYVVPIAAVTGLAVSAFLLNIPGIILSLSVIVVCAGACDIANDIRIMKFKKYCLEVETMFSTIETETIALQAKLEELKNITDAQEAFNQFKNIIHLYNANVPSHDTIDTKINGWLHLNEQFKHCTQYKDLSHIRHLALANRYYECLWHIDTFFKFQKKDPTKRDEDIEKKIVLNINDSIIWSKRMRENIEVVRLSTNIRSQRDKNNHIKF